MIESDLIYNLQDFRTLITSKAKVGTYYRLYDEFYFEEIDKPKMITREVFAVANRYMKSFNVLKYMIFKFKDDYRFKEVATFFDLLKENNIILLTVYNPKNKECFIVFISNKDDKKLIDKIENFLEMEK